MVAQKLMHENPVDIHITIVGLITVRDQVKHQAYIAFLSHKATSAWIKEGDENTSLFHQSIKERKLRN